MIVVGSYGEPPLKGVILGSTAYKLLHLTERPVLVVPDAERGVAQRPMWKPISSGTPGDG